MLLFDIARGLLLTVAISLIGGLQPSIFLILAGVLGSTLPDADYVAYWIYGGKMGKWAHKHRDLTHYPLIVIPVCAITTYWLWGIWYALLITLSVLGNYIFDSFSVGWGIRWLWPFTNRYFAYRSLIRNDSNPHKFFAWTPQEQDEIASQYGEEHWASDSSKWGNEALFLAVSSGITLGWYLFMR